MQAGSCHRLNLVRTNHNLLLVLSRIWQRLESSTSKHFCELVQELPMDQPICRQHVPIRNRERLSLETSNLPAGFLDNQNPRGRVPRVQVELPESVVPSASHGGEVKRRRTSPSHAVRSQRQLMIEVDVGILVALVAGEPCRDQALRKLRRFRDFNLLSVQECALAEFSSK